MPMLFKDGDWGIHQSGMLPRGLCLRHIVCQSNADEGENRGQCACDGVCDSCKVKAPDAIVGLFNLTKWER